MNCERLKSAHGFREVFKRGQRYADRLIIMVFLAASEDTLRVGFATQRSVGGAVQRNRVKRRLRAAFQFYQRDVGCSGSAVILGKAAVLDAPWSDLLDSMKKVLRRAGCLSRGQAAP